MLSGIFVLNSRGESMISRIFRDDVSMKDIEAFKLFIMKSGEMRAPMYKAIGKKTVSQKKKKKKKKFPFTANSSIVSPCQ
jgi:hypothetical protein